MPIFKYSNLPINWVSFAERQDENEGILGKYFDERHEFFDEREREIGLSVNRWGRSFVYNK